MKPLYVYIYIHIGYYIHAFTIQTYINEWPIFCNQINYLFLLEMTTTISQLKPNAMSGIKVPQLVFKNTNVISAGTDIVYLPRIERLLLKYRASSRLNRVLTKFMHQHEISHFNRSEQYEPLKSQVIYVAGIWAIKEALLKTLPAGFGKPPAIQIYTKLLYKTNTPDGKPELHLDKDSFLNDETKNYWNKYLERTKYVVSISHDQDYLISILLHMRENC